jgi:hypothetical protein
MIPINNRIDYTHHKFRVLALFSYSKISLQFEGEGLGKPNNLI